MIAVQLAQIKDEALADELRSRGWRCEKDSGQSWETLTKMSQRLGFTSNYIARMLNRGTVVPGLEVTRSRKGKGRIILARSSAESERWFDGRKKGQLV